MQSQLNYSQSQLSCDLNFCYVTKVDDNLSIHVSTNVTINYGNDAIYSAIHSL